METLAARGYMSRRDPASLDRGHVEKVQWVTVLHDTLDGRDFGIGSYLTTVPGSEHALAQSSWTHGSVGRAGAYQDATGAVTFDDGLSDTAEQAELFVHRRRHQPRHVEPTLEFTPSFLWYLDAVPRPDGSWYSLDDAGRDQELVRIQRTATDLRIEIAALPLRRYLAARQRVLVIQYDRVARLEEVPDPKIDGIDQGELHHYAFHSGDLSGADRPGFVRLVGKHLVLPIDVNPADLGYAHSREEKYPVGLETMKPDEQFVELVNRTADALEALAQLAEAQSSDES